ncbi:MAG: cold shock domain-containing protein [Alphaproteobacteria bacterium]|nr:cold shock domain-containing protein [Alphaproteobacteria bacterium]
MGKSRDFRGPRRRGFDDDVFAPGDDYRPPSRPFGGGFSRPAPVVEGPVVEATVKWFNPEKGFGFVALADGSGDAFLHVGVLQASGHDSVPPGAKLQVNIGQGQKGPQVTAVSSVDTSTATEPVRRSGPRPGGGGGFGGGGGGRGAPDMSTAVQMTGTVKWFNPDKGFGFVAVNDGGKDVFVHVSVLARAQLSHLAEGQTVSMQVVQTPKGREAVSLEPQD